MQTFMQHTALATLLLGAAIPTFSQSAGKTFTIHGTVKNMAPPPAVYLIYDTVMHKQPDTAMVVQGAYTFTGTLEDAAIVSISPASFIATDAQERAKVGPENIATFFLDAGNINITSDGTLQNIKVSGSQAQTDHEGITREIMHTVDSLKEVAKSEAFKTDQLMQQQYSAILGGIIVKVMNDQQAFIHRHPDASVTPFLLYSLSTSPLLSPGMLEIFYNDLPAAAKERSMGRVIAANLAKVKQTQAANEAKTPGIAIGSPAPAFTLTDTLGNPISLASFKGKYVLVDFWASWCKPCRQENPNVKKAYNTYKDKGFNVLGVSVDEEKQQAQWLAAIRHDQLTWAQVYTKGWETDVVKAYHITAIPQNFLLDPNGIVIAKNLRGEELQIKLESLFK